MTARVDTRGLPEVRRNLGRLSGSQLHARMNRAAFAIGKELEGIMKPYPPPPPQSTYRRTGTLKRNWGTRKRRWGALVANPTKYAAKVQSEEQQTKTHRRTGWLTDEKGVDKLSKRGDTIKRIVLQSVLRGVA